MSSSRSSDNTWENDQTCGWFSGISSSAYDCQLPLTCSTNTEDVVACATNGVEQFYTVCLNYEAVQSGKCTSAGPQTGCCQNSEEPECGTMLWTGSPARSMFKCFATATLISMLDQPQFVIDASRSSASASSSSAAAAASRSSAEAASRSRDRPSTVVATTTAADGSTSTVTSVLGGDASASAGAGDGSGSGGDGGGSSNNAGAIAGGVVGGTAFLALLAFLLWYLMRKNNKFTLALCGGNKKTRKEKNVDGRTYNKNNVKNDNRAYDERSYSNRNSYDNRAYDNRRSYDNHASNGQAGTYNQSSQSGAPQGPTNQHFHFHMDDNRQGSTADSRLPVTQEPQAAHLAGAAAAAAAPALSRREQRRLARQQHTPTDERDPEKEEMEQQAQEQRGPPEDLRSHRYHPSSGQRYPDAPPPAPKTQGPDLDFIGRGM